MLEREKRGRPRHARAVSRVQRARQGDEAPTLAFLLEAKDAGQEHRAYGAPAKGNTLLNYAGVRADFIDYTVDRNPHKQNHFLPGTQIPILGPERIAETRPDYLLILAWNLKDEVMQQMEHIRDWGGKFLVLIPEVKCSDDPSPSYSSAFPSVRNCIRSSSISPRQAWLGLIRAVCA